jgi:peptidoglycan/LPS O-acetylase OafA/YrhL
MGIDDAVVEPARPHDRYPCFDGVRALAALMVVVYHSVFFNTNFDTPGGAFLGTLNAGVFVFFVTSGFLLYRPFTASHMNDAPGIGTVGYLVRRAARIYPAYWLVLAFFTFVSPRANVYGLHGFVQHTTLTFTYSHIQNPFVVGIPPAWSLVVEVSFYVFLPIYAALIGTLARRWESTAVELGGVAALFAVGLVSVIAIANGVDWPWLAVLPQYIAAFALGMFLAVLSARRWDARTSARLERIGRPAGLWWIGAVLALVAIPVALRHDPLAPMNAAQAVGLNVCEMIVGFCIVVPVVFGAQDHGAIRRVLRSRPAVYLGLVSYGIYLWHWFLLRIVAEWLNWPLYHGNWLVVFALTLPIVVFASSVSWFALERPVLRFVHRVAPRSRRSIAPGGRGRPALRDA